MKVYIMTDMEGVCGVQNHDDWVTPQGRYYAEGKELLSLEINAAVAGFYAAGATEVYVVDGHGYGGINQLLLDKRTRYVRGLIDAACSLDQSFTALAFVGQHAKAGTEYAHIAHTGWFDVLDCTINDLSVGEFGRFALVAAQLGVPCIFGSGDLAFTKEAADLVKGMVTVAVKEGLTPGSGAEYDCEGYRGRNLAAIHHHPEKAREMIRQGAEKALLKLQKDRTAFTLPRLEPPYQMVTKYRPNKGKPAHTKVKEHPDCLIKLLSWN